MPQAQSALPSESPQYRKVSFYFAAHPDDWQLFMNPSAFEDVADGAAKAVFVHVTAGDAGCGMGTGGRKHPYYLARENGAEDAIRFMADADGFPAARAESITHFNAHPIHRIGYKNTASYFMRLPDGSLAGTGYVETGNQSLQRLASGKIEALSAIDGSITYQGWSDLASTLREIVDFECGQAPSVQLHVPERDPAVNPGDHPDHLATAKLALDAASTLTFARRLHHVGYASANLPENLAPQQRDMKCAVYAVTLAGVLAFDHGAAWRHYDHAFIGRDYVRIEEGTGPRDEAASDISTVKP